jgi:8-oxo-dGTP diphosphatase
MKKGNRLYCHFCGDPVTARIEDGIQRDYCPSCNLFFYENPLPVVSAIVEVDRRILLVKRGKRPYRGLWCLPSGFAETGESIQDAALRELAEEAGITGRILSLVDVHSYKSRFYGDLIFITFEIEHAGGAVQAGSDTADARFIHIRDIPCLAFPSNRRAMQRYTAGKSEYWAIIDSFSKSLGKDDARPAEENLLSDKLVELIEKNADTIAGIWIDDAVTNPSTAGFRHFDHSRLFGDVCSILSHFGSWMGGITKDADIRNYYSALGRQSCRDRIPLSNVLSTLSLIKKHLWEFALSQGMWNRTIDIYMTLELNRRIVIFFDKAVFYTTQGYETSTVIRS